MVSLSFFHEQHEQEREGRAIKSRNFITLPAKSRPFMVVVVAMNSMNSVNKLGPNR